MLIHFNMKKVYKYLVLILVLSMSFVFVASAQNGRTRTTVSNSSFNTSAEVGIGNPNSGGILGGLSGSGAVESNTVGGIIYGTIIDSILTPLTVLIVSLAVVFFLWGVFKFMLRDEDNREEGKQFMFWGIVGIFVMVSVWGLVNIFSSTFKLNNRIDIPNVMTN